MLLLFSWHKSVDLLINEVQIKFANKCILWIFFIDVYRLRF